MTDTESLPKKIVKSLGEEVWNQLRLASAISHPGESGRARENIIAAFLRKLVPGSFGLDTGFVIDSQGQVSRQVDIVIYRTDYYPVFEIGSVKHFLIESVVAVIENKARITSNAQLEDALEIIASVKRLDRTNEGNNRILYDILTQDMLAELVTKTQKGSRHGVAQRDEFQDQVFGAIVTQKSMAEASLVSDLQKFFKAHCCGEWFNLYVDVSSFTVGYQRQRRQDDTISSQQSKVFTVIPSEAEDLLVCDPKSGDSSPPLAYLAQELVNFLRVAHLIDFLPTSYLWAEGKGRRYSLKTPS